MLEEKPRGTFHFEPRISPRDRYGLSNPLIENEVPYGSRVLDVGCGVGLLGERLRKRKACHVVGVEIDHDSATDARTRLDDVIEGDANTVVQNLTRKEALFDVILLSDVLEHMPRPDIFLENARNLIRGGLAIASIPNVANWYVRANLLLGRFDYTEAGLLDKTHLRFFTERTVREFFRASGYSILKLKFTWLRPRRRVLPLWLAFRASKVFVPGLFALQFIIVARPVL